jgi:hypothetical protein
MGCLSEHPPLKYSYTFRHNIPRADVGDRLPALGSGACFTGFVRFLTNQLLGSETGRSKAGNQLASGYREKKAEVRGRKGGP